LFFLIRRYKKRIILNFKVFMGIITFILITIPCIQIIGLENLKIDYSDNMVNLGMTLTTYQIFVKRFNIDWRVKGLLTI